MARTALFLALALGACRSPVLEARDYCIKHHIALGVKYVWLKPSNACLKAYYRGTIPINQEDEQ